MSRLIVIIVAVALLSPGAARAQGERTEFDTLAMAACAPLPSCAIPDRGSIACPGGGESSTSLMPPWCPAGTRTRVRDRVLVYTIVETSERRVSGTITFRLNMNLDSDTFSGPIWGTYKLEVPDQGSWEGTWVGRARTAAYWTYNVVLHGTGELEGLLLRADGVWRAGKGDRLSGVILDTDRRPHQP